MKKRTQAGNNEKTYTNKILYKNRPSVLLSTVRTIPAIACMTLIFFFSNQSSVDSSETSGRFVKIIIKVMSCIFKNVSGGNKENLAEILQHIVRKCAHMSIYFVLFLCVFYAVHNWIKFFRLRCRTATACQNKNISSPVPAIQYSFSYLSPYIVTFLITVIYSVTDEIHQYFIPGRSCELRDVLIDSSGALAAAVVLFAAARIRLGRQGGR